MQKTTRSAGAVMVMVTGVVLAGCSGSSEQGHLSASVQGDMQYAEITRLRYDSELDVACGPGGVTAAGERDLPRWPYLQKVTPTSAEVLFVSTEDRPFRIVARTPDGEMLADVAAVADHDVSPRAGTQYVASLEQLPTGSTVCYELVADGEPLSEVTGFRTAPDPTAPSRVQFIGLGDLGTRQADQFAVLEQLARVPSDLMVVTGDVAYTRGTRTELENNFFGVYREMLGELPVFPASGNHDYSTDDARPFRDAFSLFENGGPEGKERWYSFDWGPVHFVMLDTEMLTDAQIEWLDEDLGSHDRPWTVAVAHRPPYSAGKHGSERDVRAAFSPMFVKHHVPLVLLGHEHNYERTKAIDGVTYVITGGGGRGTRPVGEEDFTAVIDQVAHFVWVEADDTSMRLVGIDAMGEPFDSVAFEK